MRPAVAWLPVLLLAACVAELKPVPPRPEAAPSGFPEAAYRAAARSGPVYRIDPGASQVVIYVYRAGALAKFGHDHVVASRDVHGYVFIPDNLADSRGDLYAPVATLSMDETELRKTAGFTTELSAKDIETTRRRMLGAVLEAEQYPYVQIHAGPAAGALPRPMLGVDVTLHGVSRTLQVPVELVADGVQFSARGEFDLRQTDFGITPFSILNGALAVQDQIHVAFHLQGGRVRSSSSTGHPVW